MSALTRLIDQQRAADPIASAWVSANAGSGKTAVLVDRITRLLLGGAAPARLLCLTYTRSAAAEMNERLNQRLGAWATMDDEELRAELKAIQGVQPDAAEMAHARSLFALTLETPGGLKIQTIHAFCEALLGRFPLEADVPARFSIIDERTARELADDIQDRILTRAANDPHGPLARAVARVAELGGDDKIGDMFAKLRGARRAWLAGPAGEEDLPERVARMRAYLGLGPGDTEATLRDKILDFPERHQMRRIAEAFSKGKKKASAAAALLHEAMLEGGADALYDAVRKVCLTAQGEPRKDLPDKDAAAADAGLEELYDRLQDAFVKLDQRVDAAFIAEVTEHVYNLAEPFYVEYEREKAAKGLLDYDDLIEKTEAMLTTTDAAQWVLYKLDGGIDHILIDEAQDTSPEQWNIVAAIAEEFFAGMGREAPAGAHRPRTIFAVGDPKQSIYSFQGADPASFLRMRSLMRDRAQDARRRFEQIELLTSFRTASPVLAAVDAVFALPDMQDGVTEPGEGIRHLANRQGEAGRVELWPWIAPAPRDKTEDAWAPPFDVVGDDDPRRRLGALIAERVANMVGGGEWLASKGRPVQPGDVLILVRRRNALTEEIIRQLKNRGVAVSGADRLKLADHMAAQDLLALARFALNARDDLNLGGLLKSPLIGLSEERLFDLAHDRKGALWDALHARRDEADFAAAWTKLQGVQARADFAPPYEFFAHELGANGARLALVQRLGADANDPIDEFLNLALAYEFEHAPSLQGFVEWFARGGAEIKRDLDRGGGMVRVMTVHGAKGLEAEVVILPDTCQLPTNRRETLLDAGGGVVLWSVSAARDVPARAELVEAARAAELREYRRLLYVAMTRARDRLIICGSLNRAKTAPDKGSWYDAVDRAMQALNAATHPLDADGEMKVVESPQTAPVKLDAAAARKSAPEALPDWTRRPAAQLGIAERPARPSGRGRGADHQALVLGQAVHALLLRLGALATLPPLTLVKTWAELEGAQGALAEQAAAQAIGVRTDPALGDLFGPGARGELAFDVWRSKGGRLNGRFDRVVLEPGLVRIVEFKTAARPPTRPEAIDAAQSRQMAQYVEAARILFPARKIVAEMVWTAGPSRMVIAEPLLELWTRSA